MPKATRVTFHVSVNEDSDGSYWSTVDELPGCFASGLSIADVKDATVDAIQLWLPEGIELGEPTWKQVVDDKPVKTKTGKAATPKRQKLLVCA